MSAIITQCDSHHISHHGIKRYWSIFLKQNFESKKDLEHSLRSADTKRAHSCYNVLATTICNPDKRLLPDDELCIGLEVVAQQIAWGVPKQLAAALQTVSFAAEYLTYYEIFVRYMQNASFSYDDICFFCIIILHFFKN